MEVRYDEPLPTCNEERRVLLFEAVREFLFNVVKHAGTDRARVTVRGEDGHITVVVEDDGQGFDAAAAAGEDGDGSQWNDELPEGGYGLAQIRRCLYLLGGRLTVESVPGNGTRSSAVVPLEAEGTVGAMR